MFDFAFPHLLQEIFNFLTSLPLWSGSKDDVSMVMLFDFRRLNKELSLLRRVSFLTSGFIAVSGINDRVISLECSKLWLGLGLTVMLISSLDNWSGGCSTVRIPFEAVFSITCQLSSLALPAVAVSSSSNEDESVLRLFEILVFIWAPEQPALVLGLPSKMLWRFSEISCISSSEHSQSAQSWDRCCLLGPLLLDDGDALGMLALNCVAWLDDPSWRWLDILGVWAEVLRAVGVCGDETFDLGIAVEGRGCCVVGRFCEFAWLKHVVFWKSKMIDAWDGTLMMGTLLKLKYLTRFYRKLKWKGFDKFASFDQRFVHNYRNHYLVSLKCWNVFHSYHNMNWSLFGWLLD